MPNVTVQSESLWYVNPIKENWFVLERYKSSFLKGVRRCSSSSVCWGPSCWAFCCEPRGNYHQMPAQKCEEKVLPETSQGQPPTPSSVVDTHQARPPLLSSFSSPPATPVPAKPGFGLVWKPIWCTVLLGVFALWFVQDTLTNLILTQHFLITFCLSRSSSSTVPLSTVKQHIYYVIYQQIDCFFSLFLAHDLA